MNLLLTSCVEGPEAPQIKVNENAQIAQIKTWFEENKTKLRLPEKGSKFRSESQELILPFFEKEPDWDKFHHYYFPDGREVFEISLENATKYFPKSMADSFPDRNPAEVVIQNIMFVKHQSLDRFDPLIARYYPANSSNEKSFEEINYLAIDNNWSGTLELFTYDEHHFVGFEIQEGEVIRNYTFTLQDENKTECLRIMDMGCTTHYYPVGYKSCVDGYCTTTIDYYIAETSCPGGGDLGTSYSYGFPTGDSGSGGTESGYNPPSVPMPMLRIYIDDSISTNPRLSCIVNKLGMTAFVTSIADFTKTKDSQQNSVIKLGPLGLDRNGQTQSRNGIQEITINSNKLNRPDLLIAKTIIHELVHAEINMALRNKGQTVLDNNFAANFDKFINVMYGTNNTHGDLHHKYMAENLLFIMGSALKDVHENYFQDDFQKLNNYMKAIGSPKGVSTDFYVNLCWQGLEGTMAFNQMKSITTYSPIKSPYQTYLDDNRNAEILTKPCGN